MFAKLETVFELKVLIYKDTYALLRNKKKMGERFEAILKVLNSILLITKETTFKI